MWLPEEFVRGLNYLQTCPSKPSQQLSSMFRHSSPQFATNSPTKYYCISYQRGRKKPLKLWVPAETPVKNFGSGEKKLPHQWATERKKAVSECSYFNTFPLTNGNQHRSSDLCLKLAEPQQAIQHLRATKANILLPSYVPSAPCLPLTHWLKPSVKTTSSSSFTLAKYQNPVKHSLAAYQFLSSWYTQHL